MKHIFRLLSFIALGIAWASAGAAEAVPCVRALTLDPHAYFERLPADAPARRPRFVFTAGLAGSGKSTWIAPAHQNGWLVISPDDLRSVIVSERAARGETVTLENGTVEKADPTSATHIYRSPEIRIAAHARAYEMFLGALAEGRNVVLDSLAISLKRVFFTTPAREQGYSVEALVFETVDVLDHLQNLERRGSQRPIDLTAGLQNRQLYQLDLLAKMSRLFRAYPVHESQIVPLDWKTPLRLPTEFDGEIPFRFGTREAYERELAATPAKLAAYRTLLELDRVHRVTRIRVRAY